MKSKTTKPKKKVYKVSTERDKAMGEFQRARVLQEATDNGFVRCWTCGKIGRVYEMDGGHGIVRQNRATELEPMNCHAQCHTCLTPDNRILMADLTWRKLSDIKQGEKIFAFEEESETSKTCRRIQEASVTHVEKSTAPVYAVTLENGDIIKTTAEHKWLARKGSGSSGYHWIETQNLWVASRNVKGYKISGSCHKDVYSVVCKPFKVVEELQSKDAGWLSGMLDADGHITQQIVRDKRTPAIHYGLRIGISQSEHYPDICNEIQRNLKNLGYKTSEVETGKSSSLRQTCKCFNYLVQGTNIEKIQLLQMLRPNKISKVDINKLGKLRSKYDSKVVDVKYIGEGEIVVLETSSRTFIAEGYAMHNCNRFNYGEQYKFMEHIADEFGEEEVNRLFDMDEAYKGSEDALLRLSEEDIRKVKAKRDGNYYHEQYLYWKKVHDDLRERENVQ